MITTIVLAAASLAIGLIATRGGRQFRTSGIVLASFGEDNLELWHGGLPKRLPRWGLTVAIRAGLIYRPVPLLWRWKAWKPAWPNPWGHRIQDLNTDGTAQFWFRIRIPGALPFLTWRAGRYRGYLGLKYEDYDEDYVAWMNDRDVGRWGPGDSILVPSARMSDGP